MKVKLELTERVFIFGNNKPLNTLFPSCFNTVSWKPVEPVCPFCGKQLKGGLCSCETYKQALADLLKEYGENLSIDVPDYCVFVFGINPETVNISKVRSSKKLLRLMDEGTTATAHPFSGMTGIWEVSSGEVKNGIMTFYLRKKGESQYYICRLNMPEETKVVLPSVLVCQSITRTKIMPRAHPKIMGGCMLVHDTKTVKEFSYREFLKKLRAYKKPE